MKELPPEREERFHGHPSKLVGGLHNCIFTVYNFRLEWPPAREPRERDDQAVTFVPHLIWSSKLVFTFSQLQI